MTRHPGQILREDFMKPLKLTASQLAKAMGVNRSTLGRLLAGEQRLSLEMAARLGACFGVPARWWLLMQMDFDAQQIASQPALCQGVTPLELDPALLLTPKGALRLGEPDQAEPPPPSSLPREALEKLPSVSSPPRREAKLVHYENGAVALEGDAP